jgi:hypothetical protein
LCCARCPTSSATSRQAFSDIIRSRASIGAIVGSYKFSLPSMVFYLQRPVMEVVLPDHLRAVFYSSSDVYFIMAEDEYNSVKDRLPVDTYVLARQQMFDLKPRNFLEGSELPRSSGSPTVTECPIPAISAARPMSRCSAPRSETAIRCGRRSAAVCGSSGRTRGRRRGVRRYYSSEYRLDYKGQRRRRCATSPGPRAVALNRYRSLAPYIKSGARILDAGAGGGEVVYVLRALGFDACGLEPDEQYARHAAKCLACRSRQGSFRTRRFRRQLRRGDHVPRAGAC